LLLAVDIGNTNIVAGVFCGETLVRHWRLATDTRRMSDEYAVILSSLFGLASIDPVAIRGAVVCSVVPTVQAAVCNALRDTWTLEPMIISLDLDIGIEIRYTPPRAVGADRIANAVAAVRKYGAPAIIVDFGTATTFDCVDIRGAYVGGAIAPGLEISEEALIANTAQLPRVPLHAPEASVGSDTISSLQSGILFGYAGLVDGLVDRIQSELGLAHVVATGGLATVIAPHTRTVQHIDMDLTLRGLQILHARNRARVDCDCVREG
jgi:type III pantothenate kinase